MPRARNKLYHSSEAAKPAQSVPLHDLPPIQAGLYNLIFYGDPVSFQLIVQILIFLSAISCMIWAGFVTFAII